MLLFYINMLCDFFLKSQRAVISRLIKKVLGWYCGK